MSIHFSTHERTNPINDRNTVLDTGFAAVQGALVVGLCNKFNVLSLTNIGSGALSNIGAGAIVGASLRLAHKVSEIALNFIADKITPPFKNRSVDGKQVTVPKTIQAIAIARKIADIALTAGIVSVALPALSAALPSIVPAISMKFSTYLIFSALENIRSFKFGTTETTNRVDHLSFGPRATINWENGRVTLTCKVWKKAYPTIQFSLARSASK